MTITIKPTEKDKILVKDSGLVFADAIVSSIPGLNIPWNLSKAFFEAGMKLRSKKAIEWVEMVRNNPSHFPCELWSNEKFQDGFVVAFEKYLVERNEEKRRIFRNIFLGFAETDDKIGFPLEKLTHTLTQLSELDIEVLSDVKLDIYGENYQIYGNNETRIDNVYNLINLGILINTTGTRGGVDPKNSPFVKISSFGRIYIKYILERYD